MDLFRNFLFSQTFQTRLKNRYFVLGPMSEFLADFIPQVRNCLRMRKTGTKKG